MEKAEYKNCRNQWSPFQSEEEWDLACFLMKNVGQMKINEFLKLSLVRQSGVSFSSMCTFLKHVDSLRTGPAWTCEIIDVVGDMTAEDGNVRQEQLELWHKDPVECVMELIGNLAFHDTIAYVPECAHVDSQGTNRIYDEMWTADWWWDVQGKLPAGATIAPIILSSDKTSLSVFSGDKKAWPVYLTIGNISKDLKCFEKKTCSLAGYRLFHHAMSLLLRPLVDAGHNGKAMVCANGYLCHVHPILAAYVADFPEQCLVACNKESHCPCCLVQSNKQGDHEENPWHSMADTLKMLQCKHRNGRSRKFDDKGLHAVYKLFWKDLPFTNIFACITPNILHQLHKGVFHDHLLQWCVSIVGEKEVDAHFQVISQYPGLRHFTKGILMVSQWTGTKHKEMQRVFVGLLSGAVDDRILIVVHSLLDFIYYAQCQQHMDLSLKAMEDSLKTFHDHKHIIVELQIHEDFNIPKIHSLQHYISLIRALGSTDDAYQASNKHDYIEQMALWLQQQEAIHHKSTYLTWKQLKTPLVVKSVDDNSCDTGKSDSVSDWGVCAKAHYTITKYPARCRVTVDQICIEYIAPDFILALKQFLTSPSSRCSVVHPTESDHFDIFHSLNVVVSPSTITGHDEGMQRAQVTPMIAARGCKPECPGHFDTVFVLEDSHQCTDALVPGMAYMPGVCVAQICIIFKLPDHLGDQLHPLVYVEWFTVLHCKDPVSSLYVVNCSMHHHQLNVSIISADHIIQLCHLQAWCRKHINGNWSSENVLDMASHFYINSYIDLDMFIAF
ncbi:hypothetical protein EDC04DRAFT_2867355 [Pisolithus marmoratus]|nr:hypothetical protein EDC04DRAFT_2867355 [Pisolithus marmoratus]